MSSTEGTGKRSADDAPAETAPMLRMVWPDALARRVARLIVADPRVAQRLTLAPERAVHATAIWLYANGPETKDDETLAARLVSTDMRVLLAEAMPGHSPDLLSALSRVGRRVMPQAFYRDLDAILAGPAATALPRHDGITRSHLETARRIVQFGCPLTSIAGALASSPASVTAAASLVRWLRDLGVAREIEETPPGSGWQAFVRRALTDLDRARSPLIDIPVPSGWRALMTVADLRQAGRDLRLCVAEFGFGSAGYVQSLVTGHALFVRSEAHGALASLHQFGRAWVVGEISITDNRAVSDDVRLELEAGLRGLGIHVGELEPTRALEMLVGRARRREFDDVGEDRVLLAEV